jgi:ribosomal-protein-alanine N-acetyltransferase
MNSAQFAADQKKNLDEYPRRFRLDVMTQNDVPDVGRVERLCFPNPWPASAYRRELQNPSQNYYVVLRQPPIALDNGHAMSPTALEDGPVTRPLPRRSLLPLHLGKRQSDRELPHGQLIGFAGMWMAFDEAHVTTIGVDPAYRGQGLGELLFLCMVDEAIARGAHWLTLEVRVSNLQAQALYRKYGFTVHGTRKRYYSDNGEDALIMWSRALTDADVRADIEVRREKLARRLGSQVELNRVSPFSLATPRFDSPSTS